MNIDTSSSKDESTTDHKLRVQQLFMIHQQSLLAYVLSLVPNLQDAQDIVQNAFLVVSGKADTWVEGTNFFAWVCTISRYEVLHHARLSRRHALVLDEDVLQLLETPSESLSDLQPEIERLKECLQQLSPKARELVMLRYHSSQMPEAIAARINWSANAVRVALTKAKRTLRDCLERQLAMESPT